MEIPVKINSVKKIIHCGDIHIRNLKRHKEYRQIFRKFYKKIKKYDLTDTLIYVAGDIAHAKSEMSPELVDELSSFLSKLADLAPTIVICGNHDTNLRNSSRLDVLSPIIKTLDHPNLFYLKDSGEYKIADVTFVVMSVFDEPKKYIQAKNVVGDTKIALFHGPVHESKTDVGYVISNRTVRHNLFDGYDMVMLGDIHRHQTLQEYDPTNKKPIMVYCGSMIQQNHGETLENHGFCYWDVKSRSFTHEEIINDYGFYTLYVTDGIVPKVDNMPKRPRLRVRISQTDSSQVSRIVTEIKKIYKVQEVTLTRMDSLYQGTGPRNSKLDIGDMSDSQYQNKLILDFLNDRYVLSDSMLEMIQNLNIDLNSSIDEASIPKNIVWKPLRFEFDNMFSYGPNNVLDFSSMRDLIGVFAPNKSGKSSIADALSFCMFDKSSRAYKAIDIMNTSKTSFKCAFHFSVDDIEYVIERKAKRVRNDTKVKVDVDFWSIDPNTNKKIMLNGEQRRDTNDIIRQYVGNYDDFVLTTLSLQGKDSLFIDKSQSERKDLMSQFIGTSIFDRLYTMASEKSKEIQIQLRKLNKDELTDALAKIELTIEKLNITYNEKKEEYDEYVSEKDQLGEDRVELTQQLVDVDSSIVDIDGLTENKERIEADIKSGHDDLTSISEELRMLNVKADEIKQSIVPLINSNVESKYQIYQSLLTQEHSLKTEGELLDSDRHHKESRLSQIESLEYDPRCSFCVTNAELFSKDAYDLKNELNDCIVLLNELEENLLRTEEELESNNVEHEHTALVNLKESLYGKQMTLLKLESNHSMLESSISKNETRLLDVETKINEYHKSESIITKNNELQEDIDDLKDTIGNLEQLIFSTNGELMRLHGEISSWNTKLSEANRRVIEIDDLEREHQVYVYYLKAVKRDGIPYDLISKTLPIIEGEVNNVLQQIVEFGMVLSMDGKNINAHIVYGDKFWTLELCSGMERFISGLAIRTALINVCNLPRSTFMIVDEGLGSLDSDNLNSIHLLFDYLKTQFDFLIIISHLDSTRDMVDDFIEIKNKNGFSQVRY